MRRHALRTATMKGLLAFVMLFAPQLQAINLNPDIDELRQEAYAQYNRWITSRDVEKRRMAADGLGGHAEQPGTVALLVAALPDKDSDVRRLAAHSLWKLSDDDVDIVAAHAALRSRLEDPSPAVRVKAAGALEASGVAAADLVAVRRSVLQAGDWFDIALAARDLIDSVDGTELVDPRREGRHPRCERFRPIVLHFIRSHQPKRSWRTARCRIPSRGQGARDRTGDAARREGPGEAQVADAGAGQRKIGRR